jgi:hypothetical protein
MAVKFNDSMSSPISQLRQDYQTHQALLNAQATLVQRFLQLQAQQIADALMQHSLQIRFTLPDQVLDPAEGDRPLVVPPDQREQSVGGTLARLKRLDMRLALRQRLAELEQSAQPALVLSSTLVRHSTAIHMVYNQLPAGRSVTYVAADGEEIPTIPVKDQLDPESAITAGTDAIAEEGQSETGRGELQVPYVPAARRFYLPQWVAFDEQDNILVGSLKEAEADLASMERFVDLLHIAVSLAPYLVADPVYQEKRYGMLGQMINQGRALARYQTRDIINTIQHRAAANDLNRGLRLSLPFFDDQDLAMKTHPIEVIPAGRIMFVPAFVVRAAREEQAKVAQDTRLNSSTRKHLLDELCMLETAFERASDQETR